MFGKWFQEHSILPEELEQDMPYIYILGHKTIKILNYRKILRYSRQDMVLLLKEQRLLIQGPDLNIVYFNEDEICIRGHIVSIIYQGG